MVGEFHVGDTLIRVPHYVKARECKVCGDGILMGFRDQATLLHPNWDYCVRCGQRYIYEKLTEEQDRYNLWLLTNGHVSSKDTKRMVEQTRSLGVEMPDYLKHYLSSIHSPAKQTPEFQAGVAAIKAKLAKVYSPKQ